MHCTLYFVYKFVLIRKLVKFVGKSGAMRGRAWNRWEGGVGFLLYLYYTSCMSSLDALCDSRLDTLLAKHLLFADCVLYSVWCSETYSIWESGKFRHPHLFVLETIVIQLGLVWEVGWMLLDEWKDSEKYTVSASINSVSKCKQFC